MSLEAYGFASADSGPHKYGFELDLFEAVDVSESQENVHLSESKLIFELKKGDTRIWWPRLTAQPQKQDWILIDEDRWRSPPADFDADQHQEYRDIRVDYPGIDERVMAEEFGYRQMNGKAIYLFIYNLFQFIGYLFVLTVLVISWQRDGFDVAAKKAFRNVGNAVKFCQLMQYLEVMHPMFRYTGGSSLNAFLRVTERNFILFFMIDAEVRMQTKPLILLLLLCWSIGECIRYPYYVLAMVRCENGLMTWLRFTMWILLYPVDAILGGVVVLRNVPYFEETQKFTIVMPNKWNSAFCMCTLMKCYLLFGLLPALYFKMRSMQKARDEKLNVTVVRRDKKPKQQ